MVLTVQLVIKSMAWISFGESVGTERRELRTKPHSREERHSQEGLEKWALEKAEEKEV